MSGYERKTQKEICVVGAGVIGLTTALLLLRNGRKVQIIAEDVGGKICSRNAGAIWGPFLSEEDERVFDWSFRTLETLRELAKNSATGVKMVDGVLAADYETEMPGWFNLLGQEHEYNEKLPDGYLHGWRYTVPIIDVIEYLKWLEVEIKKFGAKIVQRRVESIESISNVYDLVVNCTGMGARQLCNDKELYPVKGQLVVLRNPGIEKFFAERGDLIQLFYWMPQGEKIILGGTAETEYGDEGVEEAQIQRMLTKAVAIEPKFKNAEIIGYRVGFRPVRPQVRFEFDRHYANVFHNYGHAGSGLSLSWGCAQDVEREITRKP